MLDRRRLQELLGGEDFAWLRQRLERRLNQGQELFGTAILRRPSAAQRSAADRLLGRKPTGGDALRIDLRELAAVLRHAHIADDLTTATEALVGPVRAQRAARLARHQQWQDLLADSAWAAQQPWQIQEWLAETSTGKQLRKLAEEDPATGTSLLQQTVAVLDRLPAAGLPLPELAAAVTGNSHALDHDQPLGAFLLPAIARLGGLEHRRTSDGRRETWASAGVLCDELSAPVLVLGLRAADNGLAARALALHADAGEPYRITTRQLLRHPPVFNPTATGRRVSVCENPAVVAAAAHRLGGACTPLICIEGQPKTAARLVLDRLVANGIEVRYHGDFDWPGVAIANLVMHRHYAHPWRFTTTDYLATSGGTRLTGPPVTAAWDPQLTPTMSSENRAVHEEAVIDNLLADL